MWGYCPVDGKSCHPLLRSAFVVSGIHLANKSLPLRSDDFTGVKVTSVSIERVESEGRVERVV